MYEFHMKNNDFATSRRFSFDSSTFSQHWCPENKAKQRFQSQNVRQFYVFATLMSGKQSKTTISRAKCATVLRFWNTNVWKTKQNNDSAKTNFLFTKQNNDFRNFFIKNPWFFSILTIFSMKTPSFFWFSDVFVRQFYVFATKAIFDDSSTFWAKKLENTVFSRVSAIFFETKPSKNEKKNAANDAQGKRKSISRHFMRN